MVPKGWTHTTFDKHVDCLTGFAFKSDSYSNVEDDIRLLRGDNIEPGNLRWRDAKYWPNGELDNLEKYQLADGDFVIALDRTWISSGLKVAEVTSSDLPCLLVQRVARIRAKATLEQSLLRQYFSGHRFEQHVKSVQTATAVPHISPNDIKEFTVSLPPLSEQKKIAKILSTWDKAISTTEQLLANSQQQKKALMQQLLTGKKRLLDNNGVRFSGEWVHGRLGELCTFKGGSAFKEEYQGHSEGDLPFIKVSDMNLRGNEKYIGHANNWVTNETAREIKAKAFPKDAIVFAKVGAALLLNRRRILLHPTIIDNNMMAAIPTSSGDTEFIYQLMLAVDFAKFVQDGAVPSVNQGDLASFKITYPKKEEQQKIAAVLSTADQEISALQQKLAALKQEKKALMQQLLTGKRRVKVEEAA
ncbi:restriction endonuclease subunit S [Aeromonas taiwanensis]|uniref:restriction endonuclease subunit S n=1 Tax=Aeromonas taiwanensis TaxID=633417 RepID=UPI003989FB2B